MCKDSESGVYGLRFKSVDKPGSSIFLPCIPYDPNRDEHTDYPGGGKTVITRTLNGYYWTRDTDSENTDKGILLHFQFKNVETIANENSSESNTSVFSKGLNDGALYEFQLPADYLHLLNCVVNYKVKKQFKCYDQGDYW